MAWTRLCCPCPPHACSDLPVWSSASAWLRWAQAAGSAQSTPLEVTSDTPEYCLRLLARLNDLVHISPAPPPPEVIRLSTDGQRMCDQGQTRGGILRLRRAWLLLAHPESASAHPQDGTAARERETRASHPLPRARQEREGLLSSTRKDAIEICLSGYTVAFLHWLALSFQSRGSRWNFRSRSGRLNWPLTSLGTSVRALAIIGELTGLDGAALPILHRLQEVFGCIPLEAEPLIAASLNLSRAEVHGIVTFYHEFRRTPPGRHVLRVCRAEACQAVGAEAVADRCAVLARRGLARAPRRTVR